MKEAGGKCLLHDSMYMTIEKSKTIETENLLVIVTAGARSRRFSMEGNEGTFRGNRNVSCLDGYNYETMH